MSTYALIYIILLYPQLTTKRSLVDTPFQLISGFFHVIIKVFHVLCMLNKLPAGVCWRGGGATGLLN